MDSSPEPTVIVRALKDFDQFVSSGTKVREVLHGGSAKRLNFSHVDSDNSFLNVNRASMVFSSRKRPLDSLVGFDVTKKFREKESEVVSSRAEVARLEGLLHDLEVRHKENQLERDKEMEVLKAKQRRDKEMIDDLQHKLRKAQSRMKEVEEGMERSSAGSSVATLDIQAKMVKMQQDHMAECDKLHQEVEKLQERVLVLEKETEEKDAKVVLAESHAAEVEEELKEARKKVRDALTTQQLADSLKIQLEQTQAMLKELEAQKKVASEVEGQASVFQSAVRKVPQLEKEVAKLKEDNKFLRDTGLNCQLLEAKLESAQHQISLLEQRCQDMAKLQAELQAVKMKVAEFEAVGKDELELSHPATPETLRTQLAMLIKGDQKRTDDLNELRTSLRSHEESRKVSENEVKRLRERLEQEQRNTQNNALLVKRLQRKLLLVTKDRDSLKSVLTSYEAEVTINHSAVSQERTRRLEEQLTLYRNEIKRLEEELEAACQDTKLPPTVTTRQRPEDAEKIKKLQEKLLQKEDQVKELEERVEKREKKMKEAEEKVKEVEGKVKELEGEKEVLELRLETRALKGDYDPTKTKILHFKDNPLARAVEGRGTEIERLRDENESLRERVRLLEAGDTHDITQRVGLNVAQSTHSSKEVTELQEKVKSLEMCNKRMMGAFKRKSLEMREVVYRLTGYRVDTSGNNQYKLFPMYAESSDDYLLFERTQSKELQLLETRFSSGLEYFIDAYLRHENSYPAFLSAVTLDLFNRQTDYPSSSPTQEDEVEVEEEGEGEEDDDDDDDDEEEEQEDHMETDGEDSRDEQEEEEDNDNDDDLVIIE